MGRARGQGQATSVAHFDAVMGTARGGYRHRPGPDAQMLLDVQTEEGNERHAEEMLKLMRATQRGKRPAMERSVAMLNDAGPILRDRGWDTMWSKRVLEDVLAGCAQMSDEQWEMVRQLMDDLGLPECSTQTALSRPKTSIPTAIRKQFRAADVQALAQDGELDLDDLTAEAATYFESGVMKAIGGMMYRRREDLREQHGLTKAPGIVSSESAVGEWLRAPEGQRKQSALFFLQD